ncbi:ceramide glucosyltransferase-like isoform X1 [Varroa destructor]|uniref:ceramide glucosyltransferase n=1 Tax=Varroa destructor TaxID=109461 RepID=A0A7M7JCZ8_VARDE|nr:ceramide glucosyltransferase-like isoform X1 [Varroa destructor]
MHFGSMSILQWTLYGFAIVFLAGWVFVWTIHILAIINGKLKLHRKKTVASVEVPLQGVSILKPLTGTDPNLYGNLESFFTMNYPTYELLFCVQEDGCPSITHVQNLMKKHPNVAAKIFIGGSSIGPNPKINNMAPGYEAAKYPLIMVSDAGIRMKEDTLLDMVLCMAPDVGLVHQMPFTCDRAGFAAILEKVYFGTAHARIYLCSDLLGVNCATGMSALMRKDILDKAGGMQSFSQYLAEDYFFAKTFADRGWKISVSSQPAWQNSGTCDVVLFQQRLTRWSKLRFAMLPHLIILEPLSECMLLGMCVAWSTSMLFGWDVFAVYLIHSLIWFLLDWMLLCIVQNGMLPFSKWEFVIAWSFREFGALYLFCQALWDPTIRWRAGTYRLSWGGQVQEIMSFQRPHKPLTLTPHSINNVCFNGSKIPPSSHSMTGSFEMAKSLDRNEKSTIVLADDLDLNSNRGKC